MNTAESGESAAPGRRRSTADRGPGAAAASADAETTGAAEAASARAAVLAVRAGDAEAFGRLVEQYQRRLFGLAVTMVRDPATAEEVTQDAFVRAYTRLDRYDERRPFYPWLATIATRLAQNRLRRRRRIERRERPDGELLDDRPEADAPQDGSVDNLIADERNRRLWQAVEALPSGERTAVALYYRQGLKVREVAEALGVSAGTVKTFLFRARQKLRRRLDPMTDSPTTSEQSS